MKPHLTIASQIRTMLLVIKKELMMVSPKGVEKLYSRDNDIKKSILDMKSYDGFNIVNKFSIRNFIKT